MRAEGLTLREIGDELGLSYKQMRDWSYRHNREQRNMTIGKEPKPKGRPRKDGQPPRQNAQKELERLRMENKLLRDFLQSTERK
jgi:transposase-like protein